MIVLQAIPVKPVEITFKPFKPDSYISWYWSNSRYLETGPQKKDPGSPVVVHPSFVLTEKAYFWEEVQW